MTDRLKRTNKQCLLKNWYDDTIDFPLRLSAERRHTCSPPSLHKMFAKQTERATSVHRSQLSLSEIELKAWMVKPSGSSLTRSPFSLIHKRPCWVGIRTVRLPLAGALLTLAVEEKPDTAKPLRSAAGISEVKQYLNLPFLSRIDARFCSQSRIITSVLGSTATLQVGFSKRRTRRESLLLCS